MNQRVGTAGREQAIPSDLPGVPTVPGGREERRVASLADGEDFDDPLPVVPDADLEGTLNLSRLDGIAPAGAEAASPASLARTRRLLGEPIGPNQPRARFGWLDALALVPLSKLLGVRFGRSAEPMKERSQMRIRANAAVEAAGGELLIARLPAPGRYRGLPSQPDEAGCARVARTLAEALP